MEKSSFTLHEENLNETLREANKIQEAESIESSRILAEKQQRILDAPLELSNPTALVDSPEECSEVVIGRGTRSMEMDAQGGAKWWQLRQSGHTYHTAAGETKLPRERCRELEAWYQRELTKETVEIHLLPAKVEAALVKAGRTKFMTMALEEGDSKTFAKMAALAIKDPALAMTSNSPKVVINVGDVKKLVDDAPPVEVEFSDD